MNREERSTKFDFKMDLWRKRIMNQDLMSKKVKQLMESLTLNPYSDFQLIKMFAICVHDAAIEEAATDIDPGYGHEHNVARDECSYCDKEEIADSIRGLRLGMGYV